MITPDNVLRHELIGRHVLVVHATNPAQEGIHGLIVDETKNMITVATPVGLKHVPKKYTIFRVTLGRGAGGAQRVNDYRAAREADHHAHQKMRVT